MRNATTRHEEHPGAVMDGVEASRGASRSQGGERRNPLDRVGAFTGAAYAVLALGSGALLGQGSSTAGSPGQRILDEQQRIAENPWVPLAFAMVMLAQVALMVFVGYLCARVRDAGWFATTALVGGIALLIANLLSATLVIAASVVRDDLSPQLARTLEDIDGAGHLVQLLPLGVFTLFASAAALATRTLGRMLSWAGIAIGAISIGVMAASGLPKNEDFVLWPFLLVLLWIVVISLRFGLGRTRTATPATVAATVG
jgi:hypothetical protein